jgi:DmsE family decaheme c-type cytochrome
LSKCGSSREASPDERAGGCSRSGPLVWSGVVLAFLVALFACARVLTQSDEESYRRTADVAGAHELLGPENCDTCHGQQAAPRHHSDCESCHGSGQRHVQNVMDLKGIRFPTNGDCLGCHETGHRGLLGWEFSEHQRADLLCADCHDPHNGEPYHIRVSTELARNILPNAQPNTRLCVNCHAEVASRLNLPSHHPVREGMLGCVDCHSPHESQQAQLGARTEKCTQCHQAQAGPWIYNHTPVQEDCGYCHVPHGATADNLLTANQPGTCVYCHSIAEFGTTHDPQAYMTRCTDCHGAVHGSYADPHLRR